MAFPLSSSYVLHAAQVDSAITRLPMSRSRPRPHFDDCRIWVAVPFVVVIKPPHLPQRQVHPQSRTSPHASVSRLSPRSQKCSWTTSQRQVTFSKLHTRPLSPARPGNSASRMIMTLVRRPIYSLRLGRHLCLKPPLHSLAARLLPYCRPSPLGLRVKL